MSILTSHEEGWIISHEEYISRIYREKYRLRPSLFNIHRPYKIEKKKKSQKLDYLASILKEKLYTLIKESNIKSEKLNVDNCNALEIAEECSKITTPLRNVNFPSGGNDSSDTIVYNINSCDVLFPEKCRFIIGDIKEKISRVDDKFRLIVLDPPWWNKYIRRKKAKDPSGSYTMLYDEDITSLPIGNLTCPGCVVAVWCTNNVAHESAIKNDMFPSWGVTFVATWFWIKVTTTGEPVCPFTKPNGKQPFERVIIGVKNSVPDQRLPEDGKIFVSVPSALHSHKPPLNDLLTPYLIENDHGCLELFARYLLPKTTSIGLEPLRWQHMHLYSPMEISNDKIIESNKE